MRANGSPHSFLAKNVTILICFQRDHNWLTLVEWLLSEIAHEVIVETNKPYARAFFLKLFRDPDALLFAGRRVLTQ